MNTGENEQGLQKVLDMTRLISIVMLVLHFYYYCYSAFDEWHLILQKAGNNPNNNLDFRILKCIETIDAVITDEEISVSQLSKASFISESRLARFI